MHTDSEQLLIEIWLLNSETEFSLSYIWLWDKFFKRGWNSGSLTPMRVLCPKVNEGQHSVGVLVLERLVASLIAVLKLLHIRTSWRACLNTDDWVSPQSSVSVNLRRMPRICFSKGFQMMGIYYPGDHSCFRMVLSCSSHKYGCPAPPQKNVYTL